ncbi:hypothetical protein ACSBR1_025364 [Camellia fascicularis]
MASPSAISSESTQFQISGSEQDQQIMDQRKRKRMVSNRESARRSRMRKQKHVDDLMAQLCRLREENSCVFTRVTGMTQLCMNFEAENSVLRAQVAELTHRLDSLNEITECLSSNNNNGVFEGSYDRMINDGDDFLNPWNLLYVNQPIMASADNMFMYSF